MQLKGLYTAVITPFTSKGAIDTEGLRANLRYQLSHKVDGVVVLGTTGESPTLTQEERKVLIQISVEELKGKAMILVGTGTNATAVTIAATLEAEELGADAALVVTPYYNKPTQQGLFQHFAALCAATSLPICLYNVQGRTGVNIETETLKRLLAFPSIVGVKEASGSIMQINNVIALAKREKPTLSILSGDDALTVPVIGLGGHGVISVASNLIPGPIHTLVEAALKDDLEIARALHFELLPFFNSNFIETNPIPIKAAMNLASMAAGPCRLPLCDLEEKNKAAIKSIVQSLPNSWISAYGQKK